MSKHNISEHKHTLQKAIDEIRAVAPHRFEIWLMKSLPVKRNDGGLTIIKVEVKYPQLETINNSEFVIMMNPASVTGVISAIDVTGEMTIGTGLLFGIPVYDDEYRHEYFTKKRSTNE